MGQGQYTLDDVQGQYSAADIATPEPQKAFLARVNDRIAANIKSVAYPLDYIRNFTDEIRKRNAQPYVPGQGLKEIGQSLKETYSDPANIVADSATAAILHQMGGGDEATPESRAAVKPKVAAPEVASKLSDIIQSRIQGAAMRFIAKRIPGVHTAMDVHDFFKALQPPEEAPKPPVPAGPTGPPSQWGQRIAQPAPMAAPQATAQYPPSAPTIGKNPPAPTGYRALLDDQAVEEQIRTAAESEDRQRLADASRRNWAANQPGTPKSTLIEQATGRSQEKPVKFTKTPGVSIGQYTATDIQTIPAPNQDLTGLLEKSRDQALKKKAQASD